MIVKSGKSLFIKKGLKSRWMEWIKQHASEFEVTCVSKVKQRSSVREWFKLRKVEIEHAACVKKYLSL